MSLYWILVLSLLHCLSANPIDIYMLYTEEIDIHIKNLTGEGCAENDARFYSPSGGEECTVKALDCSIQELGKAAEECFQEDVQKDRIMAIKMSLKERLKGTNFSLHDNPYNCFCGSEEPEEKPFNEFLKNIFNLVQRLNSMPA